MTKCRKKCAFVIFYDLLASESVKRFDINLTQQNTNKCTRTKQISHGLAKSFNVRIVINLNVFLIDANELTVVKMKLYDHP